MECFQVQPSAELTSQMLLKTSKIPNTKGLVEAERNISSAMENNSQAPINKWFTLTIFR